MLLPGIDDRLKTVLDMFPACDIAADIGADHGRLSCNLLYSGKAKHVIVTDISPLSLKKAEILFEKHGITGMADFCSGNGLEALSRPVNGICICGIGGEVISGILRRGEEKLHGASLVLCPQTDPEILRRTLCEIGYRIDDERAVLSAGRFYVVMLAVPGTEAADEKSFYLGSALSSHTDSATVAYYKWRIRVESAVKNSKEAQTHIEWLTEVINRAEGKGYI